LTSARRGPINLLAIEPSRPAISKERRNVPECPTQITDQRTRFDRFAEATSRFVSQAAFFAISLIMVVVWVPTIALFNSVDTWQLVLNTVTSVLAFLLIALLQNSERRYDRALHRKVDALAAGVAVMLRHQLTGKADGLERSLAELEAAHGLEERI
jgi:ABC-type multidrug transport system fused ATPase/permease subunit